MTIDNQLYWQIKRYKEHGDYKQICQSVTPAITPPQITRTIKEKKGSVKVVTAITEYYAKVIPKRIAAEKRMKDIEQINQEILNNEQNYENQNNR